jgi:hypothetical protein
MLTPEVPRTTVIGDREFRDPEIVSSPDLPELVGRIRRVVTPPLAEVLDPLKAFPGLRELEHGIVVVNRVSPIGIAAGVLEVLLEHRPYRRRIHAAQVRRSPVCSAVH